MWKQRSRDRWITKGDQNTSYFHRIANGKHRRNVIKELSVEVAVLSSDEELLGGVSSFYKKHFSKGPSLCYS